jgi:GTP-binding protein
LRNELAAFDPDLARRPEVVAMTQADRPEVVEAYETVKEEFRELGIDLRLVSAVTHAGLDDLMLDLFQRLETGS